jgi:hypothetical protein
MDLDLEAEAEEVEEADGGLVLEEAPLPGLLLA